MNFPLSPTPPVPESASAPDAGALHLLDREPPEGYIREWSERIARETDTGETLTKSALIFRIGAEWLALPPAIFQEVARQCPAHSLPHRPDGVVLGIVSVRGELVICVSLGAVLGLGGIQPASTRGASGRREYNRLLVAHRNGNRLAFPVDEVHGVVRYQPGELQSLPSTLSENGSRHTTALLPWQGRTVGCLDDELLFYTLNRSLA